MASLVHYALLDYGNLYGGGTLHVLESSTLYDEPIAQSLLYSTGQNTNDAVTDYGPEILGQQLISQGNGVYRFADPSMPRVDIRLQHGGLTKPIRRKRFPAPKPPKRLVGGKPLRWYQGEWQRRLKTGWESLGWDWLTAQAKD